ncbi:pantoate--beta-alanine ligase [Pontibacter sp. G13]|uniref:pantoate--beta-alanine ligase n=1 Tax=Pontibacter sp. G13 TaxID=3074898 RepID=UPI00288A11F0|nr:pantoate--beta-alanine ligase [Pontibacter sp. G13]WNJ16188.1 pantoate--beta-alanine ligase [Pontibacter sp. G13]
MQVFTDIAELRKWRSGLPIHSSIGLVPTMGALHQGHASLIRSSVEQNDLTVVSIFVNPTQFGPNEDFDAYPRTLDDDVAIVREMGADVVFAPKMQDIYPKPPAQILFSIRDLDKKLCGASRPGHMNGVVQIVSILFHLVQPSHAYFGLKDYQQCKIIETMVKELHFPLQIVPCPIVREPDGLAMSSRNVYLSPAERLSALSLIQCLQEVKSQLGSFQSTAEILSFVHKYLEKFPDVKLDYFEVLHGEDLTEIQNLPDATDPHAFIAAFLGKTRLIDNLAL